MSLKSLQETFANYLRFADTKIEAEISGTSEQQRQRRLSIYFNAYRIRLISTIETDHPALGLFLGDDKFDLMANSFIAAHPSTKTSLRNFCDSLPHFLQEAAPFSQHPILAEIAAFERSLMDVFDAPDATTKDKTELLTLQADHWPAMRFAFHPSVRIFLAHWNCVESWQAIKARRAPPATKNHAEKAWLLWRNNDLLTEFRSLPIDEYVVVNAALSNQNFAQICEALLEWHDEDAVAVRALEIVTNWFETSLISDVT